MKIVICGSMSFAFQMVDIKKELIKNEHEVVLPRNVEKYAEKILTEETAHESIKNKIEEDLIRDYFKKIKNADAILVVNVNKKGVSGYIGGNSFLEMGFAHILNKPIFILNEIPKMIYTDEIIAMQPVVLSGDLSKLEKFSTK
jgi:predicted RNA-binding protein with PUA domain